MLILDTAIPKRRILSIHSESPIASIKSAIIDPSNLLIKAFDVSAPGIKFMTVIHSSDIREWGRLGVIINSEDDLMEVGQDLPKLQELIQSNFHLLGLNVRTESGRRLGKVSSFSFDPADYYIRKIYTDKSGLISMFKDPLIIDRSQIVNISNKVLTVRDGSVLAPSSKKLKATA